MGESARKVCVPGLNISVLKSSPRLSCPAIRSVSVCGSRVAVCSVRAVVSVLMSPVAFNVTGSNSSAVSSTPPGPLPPASSTLPLGSSVAVWLTRAWVSGLRIRATVVAVLVWPWPSSTVRETVYAPGAL